MLADATLPDGLELVRRTASFTSATVPDGLLRAHRIAAGVWGVLRVEAGTVEFVSADGESRLVAAGDAQVIEPVVEHHVEPGVDAVFHVEFHRAPDAPVGI